MTARAARRIAAELAKIEQNLVLPKDITAYQAGDSAFQWTATMIGPSHTPYAGGKFTISIQFPADYPLKAPKFTFDTKIYHPNISSTDGTVFMNVLFFDYSPVLMAAALLISIQAMLGEPNADEAVELEIAHRYKTNPEGCEGTAREWTKKHAMEGSQAEVEFKTPDDGKEYSNSD